MAIRIQSRRFVLGVLRMSLALLRFLRCMFLAMGAEYMGFDPPSSSVDDDTWLGEVEDEMLLPLRADEDEL